jgi:hypothetical protein
MHCFWHAILPALQRASPINATRNDLPVNCGPQRVVRHGVIPTHVPKPVNASNKSRSAPATSVATRAPESPSGKAALTSAGLMYRCFYAVQCACVRSRGLHKAPVQAGERVFAERAASVCSRCVALADKDRTVARWSALARFQTFWRQGEQLSRRAAAMPSRTIVVIDRSHTSGENGRIATRTLGKSTLKLRMLCHAGSKTASGSAR